MMMLDKITYLVRDYDEAINWFRDYLDFALLEDTDMGGGKRWVVMEPLGGGVKLLLAKATSPSQVQAIGAQTGDRVAYFLHVLDFDTIYSKLKAAGTQFLSAPRSEPYGKVVVFFDLYGNRWDLIEPVS